MLRMMGKLWIPRYLHGVEGPGINPSIRTGYQDAQAAMISTSKVVDKAVSPQDAQTKEAEQALDALIKDEIKIFGKSSPEVAETRRILEKLKKGEPLTSADLDRLQEIVKKLGQKLVDTVKNKKLVESMPTDLKATIAASPNADRALETYARLKELQKADKNVPKRPSDEVITLLTAGVARSDRLLGQDAAVRAAKALQAMPEADYARIAGPEGLLTKAKSDTEKQLILKAVGATPGAYKLPDPKSPTAAVDADYNKQFMKDLEKFADEIRGMDEQKMLAATSLPDSLRQFLVTSCGPTTLQMLLETMSPITAKQLNEDAQLREQWQREVLGKYGGLGVRREDADNYTNLKGGIAGSAEAMSVYAPENPYGYAISSAEYELQEKLTDEPKDGRKLLEKYRSDPGFRPNDDQRKLIGLSILDQYLTDPTFSPQNEEEKKLMEEAIQHLKGQKPPVDIDQTRVDAFRQKTIQLNNDRDALDLLRRYTENPDMKLTPEQEAQVERAKTLIGARACEAYRGLSGEIENRQNELQAIMDNEKLPQAKRDKAYEQFEALSTLRRFLQDPNFKPDADQMAQIQKALALVGADKDRTKAAQIVALRLLMADPKASLDDQKIKDTLSALGLPGDKSLVDEVKKQADTITGQVKSAGQGVEGIRKSITEAAAKLQEPLDKQVADCKRLRTDIDTHLQELAGKPPAPALETLRKYLTDPDFKPSPKEKVQIEAALRYLKEQAGDDKNYPDQQAVDGIRVTLQTVFNNLVSEYYQQASAAKKPHEQAVAEAREKARQKLAADGPTTADVHRIAIDGAVAIVKGGGDSMALDVAVQELTGRPYRADSVLTYPWDPGSPNLARAKKLDTQAQAGKKLSPDETAVVLSATKPSEIQGKYVDSAAKALAQGNAVPIRIGYTDNAGHPTGGGHFLLMTDVRGTEPNRQFLVADPWTGKAQWVTEKDLKSGAFTSDPKYGFNLGKARVTHMFTPRD